MSSFRGHEFEAVTPYLDSESCTTRVSRAMSDYHALRQEPRAGAAYPEAIGPTCAACPERSRWSEGRRTCPVCPRRSRRADGLVSLN
jgi:hypothetical protein